MTQIEKALFLKLFNQGGYVLDFSTNDFDIFTQGSVGVPLCQRYKKSKGASLTEFCAAASEDLVIKLLSDLMYERNWYVNTTAFLVQTADDSFRKEIEDAIYHDRYESVSALITDLRDRTMALGTEKLTLYFPLTGNIDVGDHNPFTVDDSFLRDYSSMPYASFVNCRQSL